MTKPETTEPQPEITGVITDVERGEANATPSPGAEPSAGPSPAPNVSPKAGERR
jgi:hypothetical protein